MYIDLLIKIKNAEASGKTLLKARYTKMDKAILDILEKAGFVKKVEVKGRAPKKIIEIDFDGARAIDGLKFLSRPSLRRYKGYKDFRPVKGGRGLLIVSTPKGVMDGLTARRNKVGGQILFEIW